MYTPTTQAYSQRKSARFSGAGPGRRARGRASQGTERTRLLQLIVCLVLFLAVFIGKGVFPTKLMQIRDDILAMISTNTDFQGAFSQLGEALGGEGSVLGQLGDFCVEVFGAGGPDEGAAGTQTTPELASMLKKESDFLGRSPDRQTLASHFLSQSQARLPISLNPPSQPASEPAAPPEQVPAAVPAAGTVLLQSDYSGQALPNNYTMDQLSLGDLETMTPVLGHLNSIYGYRDHPINGKYQFHGGVDIGGQTGDPIRAFAAGTVEYVGKDDSYGLYFQIDHGNGVKSFYAHCRTVCVTKGQTVALGDKVAEVGSSGAATGPHLHLELKYNKLHLDPTYYIEYLTDQ